MGSAGMVNRRSLIRGAAGLLVAAGAGQLGYRFGVTPETEARRFTVQLDQTMMAQGAWFDSRTVGVEKVLEGIWIDGMFYPVTYTVSGWYVEEPRIPRRGMLRQCPVVRRYGSKNGLK